MEQHDREELAEVNARARAFTNSWQAWYKLGN